MNIIILNRVSISTHGCTTFLNSSALIRTEMMMIMTTTGIELKEITASMHKGKGLSVVPVEGLSHLLAVVVYIMLYRSQFFISGLHSNVSYCRLYNNTDEMHT